MGGGRVSDGGVRSRKGGVGAGCLFWAAELCQVRNRPRPVADSPSDVHSAFTLLLPPLLRSPTLLSPSLLLSTQSSLPLRLFLPHPLSHPLSITSPPRTARFAVPSQPSWYYGNFEPIRKSIVPARKPRGGLPLQPRSSTTRMYSGPERRCFLTRLSLAFPVILRHFGTGTGNTVCFDPRGGNKRLEKEKKRKWRFFPPLTLSLYIAERERKKERRRRRSKSWQRWRLFHLMRIGFRDAWNRFGSHESSRRSEVKG